MFTAVHAKQQVPIKNWKWYFAKAVVQVFGAVSTNWFEGLGGVTNCCPQDKIANYNVQQQMSLTMLKVLFQSPALAFRCFCDSLCLQSSYFAVVPRRCGNVRNIFVACA